MKKQDIINGKGVSGSPMKLRSGEWGVFVQPVGAWVIDKGEVVNVKVTTKAGKTWIETVKIIATTKNGSVAAKHEPKQRRRSRANREDMAQAHEDLGFGMMDECDGRCGMGHS